MLDSPYFHYMPVNPPKTAEIYWTLVDPPIEGESNSEPKANFQKDRCMSTTKTHRSSSARY
jgi:hypothetical protein